MEQRKETNKMGTAPVNRLMLSMCVPMIISLMLQAVYNIVDSAFVSNMETNGEAGVNQNPKNKKNKLPDPTKK